MPTSPKFTFRLKLLAALSLVALADWLFWQRDFIATGIGWLALAWVAGIVVAVPAVRRDRRALFAAACAASFAAVHLWDPSLLSWWLFWGALMMAVLLPRQERFGDAFFWLQQQFWTALAAAFGPVMDLKRIYAARRAGLPVDLARTLPMMALPLVGGGLFIALFASANPILDRLFMKISLPEMRIARGLLWIFLFFIAWSAFRPRRVKRALAIPLGEMALLERVPPASIILSLAIFNAIFAVQNLLDIVVLWGGAGLPEGMTYAEYAHRGAYPLIVTALLAGQFVITLLRPGSATARRPVIRRLVLAWVAQNIFLVASAMLRLDLYVEAYQLTPLRLAAFVWMLLVALGLALICWRVLAGKSAAWLVNANAAAALTVLAAGSVVDLGSVSAWYNIDNSHEADGNGARLDLCDLERQGASALLPLIALESRLADGMFRDRVTSSRRRVMDRLERRQRWNDSWTWRSDMRLRTAKRRLADVPDADRWTPALDCNGDMKSVPAHAARQDDGITVDVPPPSLEIEPADTGSAQ